MSRVVAVALLSAAAFAYEILLVRVFAIAYFHHFAYMAIGVAMLGFGVGGTFMAVVSARRAGAEATPKPDVPADGAGTRPGSVGVPAFSKAALIAAFALMASPTLAWRIPLDPTQIFWDPSQWLRLAALYVLLAFPFAGTAAAIVIALTIESNRSGAIYGASFLGSAAGAVVAILALGIFSPDRCLAVPGLVAAAGALIAVIRSRRGDLRESGWGVRVAAWICLAAAIAVLVRPPWSVILSPHKALPQVEAFPGARRVAERTGPLGWVVAVDAPAFRFAPGLSLHYAGELPSQRALFVDGEIAGAAWEGRGHGEFLDWLPTSLPYALRTRARVLIVGSGGATEVANAAHHGARRIHAVELQPFLVELSRGAVNPDSIDWVVGDARGFAARCRLKFDVVTLGPGGGPGAAAAGVHALSEDFLHTTDAYARYLALLDPQGLLAVTQWLTAPPRSSVRTILTMSKALRRVRGGEIDDALVVVHGWGTATVLAKPRGFDERELEVVKAWARARGFDLDWPAGLHELGGELHRMEEPSLARAAAAAIAGPVPARRFVAAHPFEVDALDDSRPYPHHFLRARSLGALWRAGAGSWLPFAEWGYFAILATLAQSILVAIPLLALPAWAGGRSRRSASAAPEARWRGRWAYFAAIGIGYLAAEVAAIQQLQLLLGHPVYAVTATLAAILVFSGLGSAWSDGRDPAEARKILVILALTLVWVALGSLRGVHALQPAPLWGRALGALLWVAPVGFVMGTPFALGLRALAGYDRMRIAWAWAVNGYASVVAAPLASLLALEAGSPPLLLFAAGAYASAAIAARGSSNRRRRR